jgi:hypothetical protein
MVINQNMSDTVKTIENYQAAAAQLPIASAGAPPAGAPPGWAPPAATSVVVAAPPPPAETNSGIGGLPPPTSAAGAVTPSAVATAPATFTGAAVKQQIGSLSSWSGLVVAGLAALL